MKPWQLLLEEAEDAQDFQTSSCDGNRSFFLNRVSGTHRGKILFVIIFFCFMGDHKGNSLLKKTHSESCRANHQLRLRKSRSWAGIGFVFERSRSCSNTNHFETWVHSENQTLCSVTNQGTCSLEVLTCWSSSCSHCHRAVPRLGASGGCWQ